MCDVGLLVDRAVSAALTARLAAKYKELICKGAAWGVLNPLMDIPARKRRVVAEAVRNGRNRSEVNTAA